MYSHASAIVNTLQQVSGAAGTALFITLFSVAVSSATSDDRLAALADGVATAFGFGAAISVVGVVLTVFLRTPARPAR